LRCPDITPSLGASLLPISATEIGSYCCASRRTSTGGRYQHVESFGCGTQWGNEMPVRHAVVAVMLAAGPFLVGASLASADGSGDPAAVKNEGGKYYDKEGNPTFKVQSDGTVDWSTYSGFRRYHSDCHVCHGPDGEGSSYAPALSHVLKTMNYADFANVVVNGRKNVNTAQESVMPSFGTNPNVMCYLDDIFVYLRARANDAVPRGRPQKHEDKPEAATQAENSCLGYKG
jgi:methanol metabolism-related c-type cytochrome